MTFYKAYFPIVCRGVYFDCDDGDSRGFKVWHERFLNRLYKRIHLKKRCARNRAHLTRYPIFQLRLEVHNILLLFGGSICTMHSKFFL